MSTAVFFCNEARRDEFLAPYVSCLAASGEWRIHWEGVREPELIRKWQEAADLIWFENLDQDLIRASRDLRPGPARIVCRLVGTEFFTARLEDCRWEFFDQLIAGSDSTFQILLSRFDRLSSYCTAHVLPAAVDPGSLRIEAKTRTPNLAYVGRVSFELNSQLLLQIVAALAQRGLNYKLSIAGYFDNLSTRVYFENLMQSLELGEYVSFHPPVSDWSEWYGDKSYILATATQAGQETAVFRAMTAGLKPLVHNHFGASEIYRADWIFDSVDSLCSSLAEDADDVGGHRWQPDSYRRYVCDQYDVNAHLPSFLSICRGQHTDGEPKVSVALPTYNRANLLRRLLGDLKHQSYPNLEIIVSDDCSQDDTEQVVAECRTHSRRLDYVKNARNLGPCHNTASAVRQASGDYVMVCSDDDLLDHDAVAKLVGLAQRKKADLVYSNLQIINGAGEQQTVWQFRNYYDNYDLLRDLICSGCNRIPEVFLCRRELFNELYTETYGRRFLNTYFLPLLRGLRMIHLPEPVYKYTVDQQSTFNSVKGLYDRVKSTQNYINTALFMYSPPRIFQIDGNLPLVEQTAVAYYRAAATIARLGMSFVEGRFYTGVEFTGDDRLYQAYFYNAYHWLTMAGKYGLEGAEFDQLRRALSTAGDPLDFDAASVVNVPEIYRELPWFAFRPFNTASSFVALDICSLGDPAPLSEPEYEIYRDDRMSISIVNHLVRTAAELGPLLSCTPVTVLNIHDARLIEPVVRYLIENHLFSIQVLNFSSVKMPQLQLLRNVYNLCGDAADDVASYLKQLRKTTAVEHENTTVSA